MNQPDGGQQPVQPQSSYPGGGSPSYGSPSSQPSFGTSGSSAYGTSSSGSGQPAYGSGQPYGTGQQASGSAQPYGTGYPASGTGSSSPYGSTGAYPSPTRPDRSGLVRKLAIAGIAVAAVTFVWHVVQFVIGMVVLGTTTVDTYSGSSTALGVIGVLDLLLNIGLGIALLVLAILITVYGTGKARTGGIIMLAAVVGGWIVSWVLGFILGFIAGFGTAAAGVDSMTTAVMIAGLVMLLVYAVIAAVRIYGGVMAMRASSNGRAA